MRKTLGLLYWAPKSPVIITRGYTNNSTDGYTLHLTEYQSQKPPIKLKLQLKLAVMPHEVFISNLHFT
jgi:hypothetical protein